MDPEQKDNRDEQEPTATVGQVTGASNSEMAPSHKGCYVVKGKEANLDKE